MTNNALVELARGIAIGAHAGQLDKSGKPYIGHPARIAARCRTFETQVLAWVHDVVEDTAVTLDMLAAAGFPESMVLQVDALTHRFKEPREEYYARILEWPSATTVKRLDVDDNADEDRLIMLPLADRKRLRLKYAKARKILGRSGS